MGSAFKHPAPPFPGPSDGSSNPQAPVHPILSADGPITARRDLIHIKLAHDLAQSPHYPLSRATSSPSYHSFHAEPRRTSSPSSTPSIPGPSLRFDPAVRTYRPRPTVPVARGDGPVSPVHMRPPNSNYLIAFA